MTRLLPLLWIASVALASTAHAQPTKVALAIEGDSSAIGLRKAVVNAFGAEDDVQFVSAQKTTRAIEQLGIGEVHSARDAKSVAKRLAVAAVVQGEFDESDQTLTLIVYANGGQKAGSFTVDADDTKSNDFKKSLRKKMFAKLDVAAAEKTTAEDESTGDDVRKTKKSAKDEAKADKKSGKSDKADKKHSDDDEDVADDKSDKKSGKTSDKSDKKSGKGSDKADKKHGQGDEDVADDKADKKHHDDEDVADEKADKKSGKNADKADKKAGKDADKADKKHGHDDEDIADEKADKKSGKSSDKDIAAEKKDGKGSDKADKKHGHDDEDVADDDKSTKHGKSDKDADKKTGKDADKADKKRGHDDEDIADDKSDKKSGKSADKAADKKHGDDEDVTDDSGDKKAAKADKKHADDEDADEDSDDSDDSKVAGDEEDPTSAHAGIELRGGSGVAMRNIAAMRVDLGASMMGRSLRFQSSAVEGAPSGYHTKPVPGGHIEAELYPLAFKDRTKTIAGLGIGGEFDQVQGLSMPTADGMAAVKVTDRRYSVGARFRIAFGHRATSPTLTIGAGYGERKFAGGMTTGVPDVDYRMIDPSLNLRIPIGSRITAFAGGHGMLMLSAGNITKADQYGRANAMGATATAGLEVGLASHVALRLAAEGTQVNLKFYGQGTLSAMLDGDPATVDVQKARDRYYGGDATIAITY